MHKCKQNTHTHTYIYVCVCVFCYIYIYMCVCVCVCLHAHMLSVTIIILENGIIDLSSNPGRGRVTLRAKRLRKGMNAFILLLAIGK